MYTAKDICKICGVNRHVYDNARNVLFTELPPIGTGNAFQFSENDADRFQMFFLLNKTKIFRTKQIKIILDKYNPDEIELLHKRILSLISGLRTLLRKKDQD